MTADPPPATSAVPADSVEDLYENAPCGYLSTRPDGTISKINATLLTWLGYTREDLVGRRRLTDLLTAGGKIYHETHLAPLLRLEGEVGGVALDLRAADGTRLPALLTSVVKTGPDGEPLVIRTTVFDARDRRAYEREILHARRDADADRERLRRLVADLQRSLLPPTLPALPGMRAAAYYHTASASEVGGDFYDVFPLADNRWGFLLGDVCGKGVAAAAVTSRARYTLRASAAYAGEPEAALRLLNTVLYQEHHDSSSRYCTVIVGMLAPAGDGFDATLASGGHPAALLLRADGTADYQPTPHGALVGLIPDAPFTTTTLHLSPGDTLLLYTDGLTDARIDTSRNRYGSEALRRFATNLAPTDADAAIAAITDLLESFGDGLDDDAAVLALSVCDPPAAPGS
ncbi:MAG: phosphoserine phosphatase RsbU/P [Micromonosporaceae bacterium]|jgi:sigma-B regulation protein RsbU (phosphoserine phosphatase)|nr:phosphoserine phosphatase RsbU/P [Micromonosporaceae bacterium]